MGNVAAPGQHYDVFISHTQADLGTATDLARHLRLRGRSVFLAADSIEPGADWRHVIADTLSAALAVLVLVSPQYVRSGWARNETELALERALSGESLLIPVWLPGLDPSDAPRTLARFHGVRLDSVNDTAAVVGVIDRALVQRVRGPVTDQQESAALLEQSVADSERILGPDHPSTLSARANLANVYLQLGRVQEAAALLEQSVADSERILGPHHQLTKGIAQLAERAEGSS